MLDFKKNLNSEKVILRPIEITNYNEMKELTKDLDM